MSAVEIGDQLQRILVSPAFDASPRNRDFLQYVVNEAIAGRDDRIKAYAIAITVFHRDELFDPQSDPIVRIEASRLRRSLERYYLIAGGNDPILIEIPKGGYAPCFAWRHEADQVELPDGKAPAPEPGSDETEALSSAPMPFAASVGTLTGGMWMTGLALGVLAAVVAILLIANDLLAPAGDRDGDRPSSAGPGPGQPPAILLQPFDYAGADPTEAYLGRGISAEILQSLLRFDEIRVFDAQVRQSEADVMALARELGADYLLTGIVRRGGGTIRVSAQLIDTGSGLSIWGDTLDMAFDVGGLIAIENEIAARVASTLAQPYGVVYQDAVAHLSTTSPDSLSSYQCVLQMYEYRARLSAAIHARARDCLEAAVVRDPGYADAWAALAIARLDEARWDYNRRPPPFDALGAALVAADEAVRLAPGNAAAHHARSEVLFFHGEIESALQESERSLELNPNNPEVMALFGLRLVMTGQHERGRTFLEQALALNPTPPGWVYFASTLERMQAGEYAAALVEAERIGMPGFYLQYVALGAAHGHLGRSEDAAGAIEAIAGLNPRFLECPHLLLEQRNLDASLIDVLLAGLARGGLAVLDEETRSECAG